MRRAENQRHSSPTRSMAEGPQRELSQYESRLRTRGESRTKRTTALPRSRRVAAGSGARSSQASSMSSSAAGFHDCDSKVAADLKSEIDKIKADILSGAIKIESKAQPSS